MSGVCFVYQFRHTCISSSSFKVMPSTIFCICYLPATRSTYGLWPLTQTFNRGFCKTLWAPHEILSVTLLCPLYTFNKRPLTKIKLWSLNFKSWTFSFKLYSRIIINIILFFNINTPVSMESFYVFKYIKFCNHFL